MKKKEIVPKGFFSTVRNIITTKEALKDVTPVDWDKTLKQRKNEENQIIKLVKPKI